MKFKNLLYTGLLSGLALFSSCIDDETNKDPNAADLPNIKPEWVLNSSIGEAQMDPHIAERMFVLFWKNAARFDRNSGGLLLGGDNNDWSTDFWNNSYGMGWLRDANLAVTSAEQKISSGEAKAFPYYKNVLQMARIWRAQLLAQFADTYGPMFVMSEAFQGENPSYESPEATYTYILNELKEAEAGLDESINMKDLDKELDQFYGGNTGNWKKYANSLRMRMAMRLSEVAPALAQKHFEEAAAKSYINDASSIAQVAEMDGWNPYAGVMSRTWNAQLLSPTFSNLVVGLGGQEFPVATEVQKYRKDPLKYMGIKLDKNFPLTTNDPCAGYFFDGIPNNIDPRAPQLFSITGYDDGVVYPDNIQLGTTAQLVNPDNETEPIVLNVQYTWSTCVGGEWDKKAVLTTDYIRAKNFPALAKKYRKSANKRVFFGAWESYFLLAEAKLKGWNVKGSVKENYEKGIAESFAYHGVSQHLTAYLASKDYNRVGTSVAIEHTTEAQPYTIKYVDGYTKQEGTTTYTYPKNSIYNNGATNNDVLTKIITQKYIAQMPWLPLEAWSDHRRLGLPFFENPAIEKDLANPIQLKMTVAQSKECKWEFYPKRLRYPVSLKGKNAKGYEQIKQHLGGEDLSVTPLWWNKASVKK